MSFIKVDFPEPETPVKTVILPSGISISRFFKLFLWAFFTCKNSPLPSRNLSGIGINLSPDKYFPVKESLVLIMSSILPFATILPPLTPAFGPISTI